MIGEPIVGDFMMDVPFMKQRDQHVDVKKGDVVLYGKYGGTEVTVGAKDYVILRAEDILAVVEGALVGA